MVRAHVRQAAQPDAPAARALATAAIRIAIAAGCGEHAQGAPGEAVGQDRWRHVVDAVEVLLDLRVGAAAWGRMHVDLQSWGFRAPRQAFVGRGGASVMSPALLAAGVPLVDYSSSSSDDALSVGLSPCRSGGSIAGCVHAR